MNLLTGVWLHAAARAEQGLELTELERSILGPLQEVLSEEEVRAIGHLYREQRAGGGLTAVLPQAVTSRSLADGFSLEQYQAALGELMPQIAAMPNVAVVDRAKLAAGEGLDTPEFTAALGRHRFGVTGFTGEDDHQAVGPQEWRPFNAMLEWSQFICHEPAGDQGGGRDEIYWTAASNAEGYKHTTRTEVIGAVERGGAYPVHGDHQTGNPMFFSRQLNGCGAVVFTCWEKDQSNDEWYTALGKALEDVTGALQNSADFTNFVPGLDLYGHLHTALSFFTTFWEAMRNKDDLVLSRAIAFGPADLKAIYDNDKRVAWRFDARSTGMGDFTLYARYTGVDPDQPPLYPWNPDLYAFSLTDSQWDFTVPDPSVQASSGLALAAYDGVLYCVLMAGTEMVYTTFDGRTWTSFTRFTDAPNGSVPTLAVLDGKLYCAVDYGPLSYLRYASFDGSTWSPFDMIPGTPKWGSLPTLAAYENKLYCTVRCNRSVEYASFDGQTWSAFAPTGMPEPSHGAAMTVFDGKLYAVIRTDGHNKYMRPYTFDGDTWTATQVNHTTGNLPPALAALNGQLYGVQTG